MLNILKLFGRSPFVPIQHHMDKVAECVEMVIDIFSAVKALDFSKVELLASEISKLEHIADDAKNDIRNHLPKSLFISVDKANLLEILALQDTIADNAEDIAVLLTLKQMEILPSFAEEFDAFLEKNVAAFHAVRKIIGELNDLVESSFGGIEAARVRQMVDEVAYLEHEADLLQRTLMKKLYNAEDSLSFSTFYQWQRITQAIANISNISEKLAYRVRMTLDLR